MRSRGDVSKVSRVAALLPLLLLAGLPFVIAPAGAAAAGPGTITTWAGGTGEGPGPNVSVRPIQLAASGFLVYIADDGHDAVRALDTRTGELRTVAGNGDLEPWADQTPRGDGGPATADRIDRPAGVAVDAAGRVYISDLNDHRVRRVDASGTISTFAGGGTPPTGIGDGGPATKAVVYSPAILAFNAAGDLFVADGSLVRRISTSGVITTVAGAYCSCSDFPHENLPALQATLQPLGMAVDPTGHVVLTDSDRVLRIDDAGILRRFAGGGSPADGLGDGGPATDAKLVAPVGLSFDGAGNLLIADSGGNRVRKVDVGGRITTVAGGGSAADGLGDNGPALAGVLSSPTSAVAGPGGALYISDTLHRRVRKVSEGAITTVAGNGEGQSGGDGGPAAKAQFFLPTGFVRDAAGNSYVADTGNHRVRRIDTAGRITTVAGTGERGLSGDGGAATAARLSEPRSVAVDTAGNVFVADTGNSRIRRVAPGGTITTVAGGGTDTEGDGGPATAVALQEPRAVAVDGAGNLFLTDERQARVRMVTPAGIISTFAGGGSGAGAGDGGPARSARLGLATNATLAFDPLGQLYISDSSAARVRKVDLAGVITTVLGGGQGYPQFVDELQGQPATSLHSFDPGGIAFDSSSNLYVIEGRAHWVMKVDAMGRLRFVGGTGDIYTGLGDGGPATKARIDAGEGSGMALDAAGNLYVVDGVRVRRIESAAVPSRVLAVGWNGLGQLGDGSSVDRRATAAAAGLSGVKAVGAGYYHTLAARADGTVWAWGWNRNGQLGDGSTTDRPLPTAVKGLSGVVAVAGGIYHSLALRADGSVWAWGGNALGQVGDGTTTDRTSPVKVAGLSGVSAIAAGGYHNLALTNDGSVWAWGYNGFGQLGTGSSSVTETRPVRVPGAAGATSIAAGAVHSLAVRLLGQSQEVWAWGWNALGQLGDGTTTDRRTPVKTPASGDRVFAGAYHSFVGGVRFKGWGYNAYGQLGTGSTATIVATPTDVALPLATDSIAGGLFHTVALAIDGSVMTWGWNGYGALGNGTLTARALPVVVPGVAGAGAVAAGAVHSIIQQ